MDGSIGTLIKNKNFSLFLLKSINNAWGINHSDNIFPGPQPVSIEKKDFEKLEKFTYYTSVKNNGTRYIMFFIKDKNNKQQTILVNRALQCFTINMYANDELFNGTIFDGELIMHNNEWVFIIHDSVMICGSKINRNKFSERLEDIQCCLSNFNITGSIKIELKKFYLFSDFENFLNNEYNTSKYEHDGIIFMPETLPVISGTQYSMFKWKPVEEHTIDFLMKKNNDDIECYVFNMGKLIIFSKIHYETEEGKKFIETTQSLKNYNVECIVECKFIDNKFIPVLVRTDKNHANSLRTVERTLFNINENINIDNFQNILKT